MKNTYTRRQIQEAIAYREGQLKAGNISKKDFDPAYRSVGK